MIVLLEGGEGAGKTTIAKRLEREQGFKFVKFPTPGSLLENIIFNKEAALGEKAVAATLDFCRVLREEMKSGQDLVLDRGPWSTIAYQGPYEFKSAIKACEAEWTISAITHAFLFDVDAAAGLAREEIQNEVSGVGLEFHTRVNRRMRHTYAIIKNAHNLLELDEQNLLPPFYPEEDVPRVEWCAIELQPWTKNVYRIDTNDTDENKAYLEVLEGLGLVGAAR